MIQGLAIALVVFTPFAFGTVQLWSEAVAILLVMAMVAWWVVGMVRDWEVRVELPPGWLPAALFLGLVFLQTVPLPPTLVGLLTPLAGAARETAGAEGWASLSLDPAATWRQGVKLLAVALFFLVLYNTLKTRAEADRLVWTLIVVTAVIAFLGIMQRALWNGHLLWVGPQSPTGSDYAFGPFVNRVHFVGLVLAAAPLGLAMYLRPAQRGASRRFDRARSLADRIRAWNSTRSGPRRLVPLAIILMGGAALVTGTRGGVLSLLTALLVMAGLAARDRTGRTRAGQLVGALGLVLLVGVWIGGDVLAHTTERLAAELGSPDASPRLAIWSAALDLWDGSPLVGTGLASFASVFPLVRGLEMPVAFTHAESDWFSFLVETGPLGLALILIAVGLVCRAVLRRATGHPSREVRLFALAAFVALAGAALHGVANFNLTVLSSLLYPAAATALALRRPAA